MSFSFNPVAATTRVLLHGCSEEDIAEVAEFVELLQPYAGHPYFMAVLILEMHQKRLVRVYEDFRQTGLQMSRNAFANTGFDILTGLQNDGQAEGGYRQAIKVAHQLSEQIFSLQTDLAALRAQMNDIRLCVVFVSEHSNQVQKEYMEKYGSLLTDRLDQLMQENDHLQAKTSTVKESALSLIGSVSPGSLTCYKRTNPNKYRCGTLLHKTIVRSVVR